MKNKLVYMLLIAFIGFSPIVSAQPVNYPTKVVNGVEYYIYTIEAGEGLFSISRRFGVSQSDINNANPQIHEGLQAGQEILIPKMDEKATVTNTPVADQIEYVLHTVERRQTLFAISRKYNVSQDLIIQSNPQLQNRGIQPGDVLRIPVAIKSATSASPTAAPTPTHPATTQRTLHIGAEETYITHNVVQGETLYSVGRRYNVSVDELRQLNPETADGLKSGTTLKVPFKGGGTGIATTSTTVSQNTRVTPAPRQEVKQKSSYKIAYLLPFMKNDKNDRTVEKFIEFYMGSLLAINNFKNGDMKFEISTFDTEKTETKLFEIINKPEMQEMDLIIGPAYTSQIPILADFAKRRRINTVIPFSSKIAHIDDNPYLFQFNPNQDIQNDYVVDLLKNNFRNANFIFVETGSANWSDDGMDFFKYLKQRLDRQRIGFSSVKAAQISEWSVNLAANRKNIVIFDTDEFRTVQSHLSNLHDLNNQYDLGVLGQYAWRNNTGKKPKMYYVSPFAGNRLGTQFYEQEFQKYYGKKLPIVNPRFDLLGYDLTTYLLSLMKKDGFTFTNSTQTLNFDRGVQSDFNFKRAGRNGGFVNHQLYLIEDEAKSN